MYHETTLSLLTSSTVCVCTSVICVYECMLTHKSRSSAALTTLLKKPMLNFLLPTLCLLLVPLETFLNGILSVTFSFKNTFFLCTVLLLTLIWSYTFEMSITRAHKMQILGQDSVCMCASVRVCFCVHRFTVVKCWKEEMVCKNKVPIVCPFAGAKGFTINW